MIEIDDGAPYFSLSLLDGAHWSFPEDAAGKPALFIFFETDCPTCHLTIPYINRLAQLVSESASIVGISQDGEEQTLTLVKRLPILFPVLLDTGLGVTRAFDPVAVPTLFLVNAAGRIIRTQIGFNKQEINEIASAIATAGGFEPPMIAEPFDGNPDRRVGCVSRHLELLGEGEEAEPLGLYSKRAAHASRLVLDDSADAYEYCAQAFADPLPVVPPTVERVDRMLSQTELDPTEIIAHIPPNYGAATVEKIAANAVMAGCAPEMMRVLIPLIRAVCDERFNIHGIQATTHFAAPLVIVNGPLRHELGFASRGNVFSNVARANSTLGRALQLILINLGGARPAEIDMSALGNPGKFSYCIAENEEDSPWEPLHVELGFAPSRSTVTLFAGEAPSGVSEHNARLGETVLKAIAASLATVWSYRLCAMAEAVVVICPEHAKTIARAGFTKQSARAFLFDNTGVPLKAYQNTDGEGVQFVRAYEEVLIGGEPCYRKFRTPESIKIIVAGGTAGKFSAVIGSWSTGSRGSQMVTYPV